MSKRKHKKPSKKENALFELEAAAMILGIAGTGDAKALREYKKAVKAARAAGVNDMEIYAISGESAEVGQDLLATFSQLGSVTIGTSKGAVKFTPTAKGRRLAALEAPRLRKKYGPKTRKNRRRTSRR